MDCAKRKRGTSADGAVRNELDRRRAALHLSLRNPHPESAALAELGFDEWARGLPDEDTEALVDSSAGRPIRWIPGEGWVEGHE
jgi:hypothetical protein